MEADPTEPAVLARLERIDALERSGARGAELLAELRGLLADAVRVPARRGQEEVVVERVRKAPYET